MTKSKKTIIAVLAVLLVISAALAVITGSGGTGKTQGVEEKKLSEVESLSFDSEYPLIQMQDGNFFCEPYPDGTFKFYEFDGGSFTEVTDVKNKTVTIEISYQPVKVKIYYIKTDKGMAGYGLFNSEQGSDVKLISYAFIRMMKCPVSFKNAAKTDYILLADLTANDAYKPNKSYSEMYSFDLESGKASAVFNQRDRTVQENGTANEGWTIFTDDSINTQSKKDLFASTRVNDTRAEEKLYCLMTVANASEKIKSKNESATVQNCVSGEFREKDNAYYCLVKTDSGFDLVKNKDKKNPVHSFSGSMNDYLICGDWILNKATNEVTNFYTGDTKSLQLVTSAPVSGLIANKDGTKFVLFANGEKKQTVVLYNTESGTAQAVSDKLFNSGICNFCFADNEHVIFSDYTDNGSAVNNIIKF